MTKKLRVTMPDGSQYDVPAALVAMNRATYYAEHDTGKTLGPEFEKVYAYEFDYTMRTDDVIMDWAANNMNWSDVSSMAKRVMPSTMSDDEFQEGWINGEKEIVE